MDLNRLKKALKNADKAGDFDAAKKLAAKISEIRSQPDLANPEQLGEPQVDATTGMSDVEKFRAGAGKAFVDVGRGVKDIGLETKSLLSQAGAGARLLPPEMADKAIQQSSDYDQEIAQTRERDKPLMDTGAGFAGNLTGNLAVAAAPGPGVPNTMWGATKLGGLYGAVQPTAEDESRILNTAMGAGAGAAGYGTVAGTGAILGMPSRALEPVTSKGQRKIVGSVMRNAAGDQTDDVVRALRNAPEYVPGSQPTTGQAAGSGGMAALERTVSAMNPQAHSQRMLEQNAARIAAMDKVARDPAARQAAAQARSRAAQPLLNQVSRSQANVDTGRVNNLIEGIKSKNPARKQLVASLDDIKSTLDYSDPQSLKSASQNIGDMLNAKGPTGAKINEAIARELSTIKRALDHQISKAEPAYGQYMQQFREMSKPINQMDVAQEMVKKSTTPTVDAMGNPTVTPRALAQTLRGGDQLARRATGFKRARMEDTLSPEQLQAFRGVSDDLSRAQVAQNIGRGPGSDTVQKLSMSHVMGGGSDVGPPTLLSRPAMIANYLRRIVYDKADKDMQEQLMQALLDPRMAADLMEGAAPSLTQSVLSPVGSALRRGAGTAGAVVPLQNQ